MSGKKEEEDSWNAEDWGEFKDTSATSASKKKKQPKKEKNRDNRTKQKKPTETATANLIDFGDADADDANSGENANNGGWDNEVWAQEDEAWESLDLSTTKSSSTVKSKKGD